MRTPESQALLGSLFYIMRLLMYSSSITQVDGSTCFLLWYPAASLPLKRLRPLLTTATRSGRFICHRQRSPHSPSRTQKLSSYAPTILGGRLPGKIGNANTKSQEKSWLFFYASNSPPHTAKIACKIALMRIYYKKTHVSEASI